MRQLNVLLPVIGTMVAFATIGVSLYVGPWARRLTPRDERQITIVNISLAAAAAEDYRRVAGQWPTTLSQIPTAIPISHPNIFTDGWGRPMVLLLHTNAPNTIWIESYGGDGLLGGYGTNADVVMELH
jgi:hypothetical protein